MDMSMAIPIASRKKEEEEEEVGNEEFRRMKRMFDSCPIVMTPGSRKYVLELLQELSQSNENLLSEIHPVLGHRVTELILRFNLFKEEVIQTKPEVAFATSIYLWVRFPLTYTKENNRIIDIIEPPKEGDDVEFDWVSAKIGWYPSESLNNKNLSELRMYAGYQWRQALAVVKSNNREMEPFELTFAKKKSQLARFLYCVHYAQRTTLGIGKTNESFVIGFIRRIGTDLLQPPIPKEQQQEEEEEVETKQEVASRSEKEEKALEPMKVDDDDVVILPPPLAAVAFGAAQAAYVASGQVPSEGFVPLPLETQLDERKRDASPPPISHKPVPVKQDRAVCSIDLTGDDFL
jgi:hypothetical protein